MIEEELSTADQIVRQAYELFLERGCEDDRDLGDLLAAKRELRGLSKQFAFGISRARAAAAGFHAKSPTAGRTA